MSTNTQVAVQAPRFELTQIREIAGAIAQSGLFGIKTEAQAYALMLIADAEGLHPATVAQDYDVIQNRPARKTHSVLARFQAAGGSIEWQELSEQRAAAKFSHPRGGSVVIEWTLQMAQRAGLTRKDNWAAYPRAMLRARCIAEGVRACYPAAIGGALLVEEAQDLDPLEVIDVTPAAKPELKVARKSKPAPAPEPESAPAELLDAEQAPAEAPAPAPTHAAAQTGAGEAIVGAGELAYLRNKSKAVGADLDALLAKMGGLVLEKLTKADFHAVKGELLKLD